MADGVPYHQVELGELEITRLCPLDPRSFVFHHKDSEAKAVTNILYLGQPGSFFNTLCRNASSNRRIGRFLFGIGVTCEMKLAIDSYCYHRYFGECYPGLQQDPGKRMTVWDFLRRAHRLGVAGVSIEACFLPAIDHGLLSRLRDTLDTYGLDRVWAWGHPDGLRSGTDRQAVKDLVRHLEFARQVGAKVMRIVGGSRRSRPRSWSVHRRQLGRMLRQLVGPAEESGVIMAMENHIDLHADEMREIITSIDSPWLGVCLDTANNIRLFEDPVEVARVLAPWVRATHVKDVGAQRGNPREFSFWPSVPLGEGLVELPEILHLLKQARYRGLLAFEIDYLHPNYGQEERAIARSIRYLRSLITSLQTS